MYSKWFARIQQMSGASRVLGRIASAPDREQLEDYLAEVIYSLVFAGLGFQVEIEPLGGKGPDLRISREGHSAYVEVMRFRRIYSGPPTLDPADDILELSDYGDLSRDTRKAYHKILAKFRQVGNEPAIIAIWNDDGDLQETAVEFAANIINRCGMRGDLPLPSGLLFVLYGSIWWRPRDPKQLYCFTIHDREQSYQAAWQQELASSTVRGLIQRALTS